MRLIFLSIMITFSLFAETLGFLNSSSQQKIPYELKKWEAYVYKKGDKFYKAYTSNLFSGTGILINDTGLSRIVIKKGLVNGKYELFDKNGAIILRENYSKGIKNGLSEVWDNEKQIQSIVYKDGVQCDGWIKNQNAELSFKECKKSGWEYLTDGTNSSGRYKKIYESDDIINISALDKQGKEIVEINSNGIINECKLELEKWSYAYEKGSFDEFYKIEYTLRNNYTKEIKSLDGGLYFQDLVGNPLYGIALTKDVKISSMNTSKFSDNYLIDQFKQEHYKMKHMDAKDVQVEMDLKKIVFTDNTVLICDK